MNTKGNAKQLVSVERWRAPSGVQFCGFFFSVCVEGGVLVRQGAKLSNHKGGGRHVVAVKPNGFPSGKSGSRAVVASSGV
jgi:hypothetical protein